jgi:2-oxoglutarate dehydrogenase E2 component (dihydrolipoamide succinyltransferase)
LKWHKKVGDAIKMDETLLEIATDKVDSEVPSTAEGTITEILFNENDVVAVGKVIARIQSGGNVVLPKVETVAIAPAAAPAAPAAAISHGQQAPAVSNSNGSKFYSPLVLNIAASEGIAMSELENISGTGNEGRVTKKDIIQYVAQRKSGVMPSAGPAQVISQSAPEVPVANTAVSQESNVSTPVPPGYAGTNVEIIEMDRMRKMIADHMVRSKATSPHVTSFTEADVTTIVNWRNTNFH